jgi:hypothetical protein
VSRGKVVTDRIFRTKPEEMIGHTVKNAVDVGGAIILIFEDGSLACAMENVHQAALIEQLNLFLEGPG